MEIISIPLKGALSHKDSMDNKRAIEVGEVQVMSAGTGMTHSEFNDSKTEDVNFLQLWIIPEEIGVKPNYEQRSFNEDQQKNKLQTVVAPKDKLEGDALPISQQAYIYRTDLEIDLPISIPVKNDNNGLYIFIIEGEVDINEEVLTSRDAMGLWEIERVEISANQNSKIIIIEVPMN